MPKAKFVAFILSVLTMSFLVGCLVFAAWTEPSQSPPLGNVPAPLNVGSVDQIKSGGLSVGAFISQYGTILANASGNVGIGTASPTQKLDVAGYVKGQSGLCIGSDCRTSWPAGGGGVTSVSNYDGTLTISPTTGAVVASLNLSKANTWTGAQTFTANTNFPGSGIWNTSGNVGIGTASPTQKLDVVGFVKGQSGLCIGSDCRTSWPTGGGISGSGTANYVTKWTGSTSVGNSLIYDNGTNVAIGTTTPTSDRKLEVVGGGYGRHTASFIGTNGYGIALGYLADFPTIGSIQAFRKDYSAFADLEINPFGGNVGVGTPTPKRKFEVVGGSAGVLTGAFIGPNNYGVALGNDNTNLLGIIQGYQSGVGFKNLGVNPWGGNVGIGTVSPGYTLTISGTAWVSSGSWSGSDIRWKKDIIPLENSLAKIIQLQGIGYDWRVDEFPELKFPSGRQIGLIAQEVEQIIPEIVSTDQNGYKGISYEKLTPVLIEAIKEQQKEIEELRNEIEILKQKIN